MTREETAQRLQDYIPRILSNHDYQFGSRCFSVLHIKYGGRTFSRRRTYSLHEKRARFLCTKYGLSLGQARIFVNRRASEIRRIEETIHGVFDSLLLFDRSLFYTEDGLRACRAIVRKTITLGSYSLRQVVGFWKEFTTYLYNRIADIEPALPKPSAENFYYRALKGFHYVKRIEISDIDYDLCTRFAHICSSRQLPAGDAKAEEDSLKTFFESIEEPYDPDPDILSEISVAAAAVGRKCIALADRDFLVRPHISLNCGGSYYKTVRDGGRGSEIREAILRILPVRPDEDERIQTPFGELFCPKGEERWRHWCRAQPYTHYPETKFGEVIKEEVFAEQNLYFQGYDEAIGRQIIVCAYLDYRDWASYGWPIPTRTLTIPEPGYKARIVTTGPYWTVVLPQALSHYLRSVVGGHPSARSCMLWTDQAWQSLYLMSGKRYPKSFWALSSDLKEATDHIPKVVARALLEGFLLGTNAKSNLKEVCLSIIMMDRHFESKTSLFSVQQTRGVMMGEPLTKVILTVLNLAVEEAAMRKLLRVPLSEGTFLSPWWRSYHVGGDDHLAIGPKPYLHLITHYHLRCGSKISMGKHGLSQRVVRYCEKVLMISNLLKRPFNVKDLGGPPEVLEASPFIDSIKVRLLSPTGKTFDVISERNVAIGKGMTLGRTLQWLNPNFFDEKLCLLIRDRFIQRMGSLLPDRSSGVLWQTFLPPFWGGLGLLFPKIESDLRRVYERVPELTKSIMEAYLETGDVYATGVLSLQKFLSNSFYRGFSLREPEEAAMRRHLEEIVRKQAPSRTWREIKAEFDPEDCKSAKETSHAALSDGWWSEGEVVSNLLRPLLFKEILTGLGKAAPYNTIPLKTRYARLWEEYYPGPSKLSFEDFKSLLRRRPQGLFYRVGYPEEHQFYSDRGYLFKSILDDALHGMPVLSTSLPYS
uniref:RNA-dependent RNA polymerase n=1 Tax=Qingyang Narna tick virus 1 TaxID=2972239 RepID=A0A9E8A9E6_9VIRU|nr:MAG: RNA-dependent RNA polymerase [Qingyang Narna tick virus 1]